MAGLAAAAACAVWRRRLDRIRVAGRARAAFFMVN
jgi:hypothetical protein